MALEPRGPAELTERVRFERRASAADGYGSTEGDWATLIESRSAKLLPTRGGEQVIAQRQQGTAIWDLWVRYDSATRAVTADDRVVDARDDKRTFNIRFGPADMTGSKRWLLMQLEQGQADG